MTVTRPIAHPGKMLRGDNYSDTFSFPHRLLGKDCLNHPRPGRMGIISPN